MSSFLVILVSVVCLLSNARRKINNPCMYPYTLWYARWRIVSTSCVVLAMADDLPSLQASSHVAGAKRNRVPSVLCGMTRKGHGTNQVQRYLVRSACSMKRSLTLVKKLNAVVKRLQTETKLLSMSHPRVKGHEKLLCKHLCSQSGEVFLLPVFISPTQVELPNALFMGQLPQLQQLLNSVSAVQQCRTPNCNG